VDLETIQSIGERLRSQVHRVVVGHDAAIELMLVALLARGHVLLEGVPGTAKTLLAYTFAAGLDLAFRRIQFTPDLMPGDITGTNLFNFQTNQFALTKGPIFTDVLLADELNRTPPKTQAALLEAMQERSVTIDGVTHRLGAGFLVIATQNPIEQEGTYPLPEAQLDRFLFKLRIGYPSRDQEREMVRLHGHQTAMPRLEDFDLPVVADLGQLEAARASLAQLKLSDEVADYVVDVVRATRQHPALLHGASPRSTNMLASAARALAVLAGRDFVIPDDVKRLVPPTLRHRVVLAPAAEIEGLTADKVLQQVLDQVASPR
jgi:MoxR-like ATPase